MNPDIATTTCKRPIKRLHISDYIYREIASQLLELIDGRDYISDESIHVEDNGICYSLNISAIVYYDRIHAPDGIWDKVSNIIPVWSEFHTEAYCNGYKEFPNDFQFSSIKRFI